MRDGGRTTSAIQHNNLKRTSNFGVSAANNPPNFNMINGQYTHEINNSGEELPEDVAQELISMHLGMHPAANNQSQTPTQQLQMHHIGGMNQARRQSVQITNQFQTNLNNNQTMMYVTATASGNSQVQNPQSSQYGFNPATTFMHSSFA